MFFTLSRVPARPLSPAALSVVLTLRVSFPLSLQLTGSSGFDPLWSSVAVQQDTVGSLCVLFLLLVGPLSATSLNLKDFLFRYHNVPLDEIFFWWQLKGGDVHATLVERGAFRPVPPILRLPLCCLLRPASSSPALLQPEASSSAPVASLTETRHSPGVHADSTVALGGKAHPREAHSWSDASTRLNVSGRVAGAAAFAPAAAQGAELGVGLTQQSPEDLERVPLLASMLDLRQLHSISDLHRGRPPELAESQGQASVCACQKLQAYGCQILQSASLQPLKGNARGPCTGRQRESHSPPSQERHRQRGELVVGDSPSDFPWERTPSARLPSADSRTGICGGTTSPCSRLSGRQSALEFPPTKDKGRGLLGGPQLPAEEMNGFPGRGIEGPTEEEELQGRTLEGLGVVSECSFFSTGFGKGRSWRDVDIPWIEGDARIRGQTLACSLPFSGQCRFPATWWAWRRVSAQTTPALRNCG